MSGPRQDPIVEGRRLGRMVRWLSIVGATGGLVCISLLFFAFHRITLDRARAQSRMEAVAHVEEAYRTVAAETRSVVAQADDGRPIEVGQLGFVDRIAGAVHELGLLQGPSGGTDELRDLRRVATDLRTLMLDLGATGRRRRSESARLRVLRDDFDECMVGLRRRIRLQAGRVELRKVLLARSASRARGDPTGDVERELRSALRLGHAYAVLDRETAEITRWVERLHGMHDPARVPDVRDNLLATAIDRLLEQIGGMPEVPEEDSAGLARSVERIAGLLFGNGWRARPEDQSVVLGRDGLLRTLELKLGAERRGEEVAGLIFGRLDDLGAAKEAVDLAGMRSGIARSEEQEKLYLLGAVALGLAMFLFTAVFLRIAWKLAAGVRTQVEDLAASRGRLQEAYEQVKQASRARDRFLANASHELRTPLNAVIGTAEVLTNDPCERADHRARIREIHSAAESLLQLIESVLDYASLEAGEVRVQLDDCDLVTLVEGLARRSAARAARKGLVLTCAVMPGMPVSVLTDAGKVRRIVGELLENAIKFTDEGEIGVLLAPRGREILIEVRDTGPGMELDAIRKAREGFFQKDDSTRRQTGGLGIGVALVSRMADALSATLDHQPAPQGRGLVATLRLPAAVPEPSADAMDRGIVHVGLVEPVSCALLEGQLRALGYRPRRLEEGAALPRDGAPLFLSARDRRARPGEEDPSRPPIVVRDQADARQEGRTELDRPWRLDDLERALTAAPALEPATRLAEAPGEGVRVLLVDDNALNLRIACKLLMRLGCTVDTAINGEVAVAACRASAFDLVMMDCQMPVMDGYEATAAIRADGGMSGTGVAVVALTANALPGDRERCLNSGMDDYLAKPVRIEGLRKMLERWVLSART